MASGESSKPTTLQRPYLLRAMHEWMTDNDLTPHIVIDVSAADGDLPMEYVKDGRLVLNLSYSATQNLYIGNEYVSLDARFHGVPRHLDIPILAIAGIYARETGQGMIFSSEQAPAAADGGSAGEQPADTEAPDAASERPERDSSGSRPRLKVIK
jgi:stringent starvation protein B